MIFQIFLVFFTLFLAGKHDVKILNLRPKYLSLFFIIFFKKISFLNNDTEISPEKGRFFT